MFYVTVRSSNPALFPRPLSIEPFELLEKNKKIFNRTQDF